MLESIKPNKLEIVCLAVVLGFGLTKVFINLISPPFGWDNLNYHFTFPVEWLKYGNLSNPITVFDSPAPTYYPINGSLFFLWFMLPLRNVFIADLGQIPFFFLGFIAIYSIAKKINLKGEYAFLAACLFTLIPNYFKQLEIAYVDVMVSSLFLVALNYLLQLNKEFNLRNVIIFSMSLGILIGMKTLALPYSILLALPFIYLIIKNYKKSYFLIILIFSIIILGGFSYIRNYIETDNPFYPMQLRLLGKTVFKGVMDASTFRVHFKAQDYNLSKMLFHEGLGAQALLFILPSVFLSLPVTMIRKRKTLDFIRSYFLLLPILIFLTYRYIIPLANVRYLYNLLALGVVLGFYLFSIFNLNRKILTTLVTICILSSIPELASHGELIISIISTSLLLFLLKQLYRIRNLLITPKFVIFSFVSILTFLTVLEKYYLKDEYPKYITMQEYTGFWPDATSAWVWVNVNSDSSNIAYTGRPVPFPLYGSNFKNNVFYVSVNKTEPAKLHYFPDSYYHWDYDFLNLHKNLKEKGNYRSNADYQIWFNNLLNRNTDYLFIYSLHQTKDIIFPLEDIWASSHPETFELVFQNDTIRIYKIIK